MDNHFSHSCGNRMVKAISISKGRTQQVGFGGTYESYVGVCNYSHTRILGSEGKNNEGELTYNRTSEVPRTCIIICKGINILPRSNFCSRDLKVGGHIEDN